MLHCLFLETEEIKPPERIKVGLNLGTFGAAEVERCWAAMTVAASALTVGCFNVFVGGSNIQTFS